MTNTGCVEIYDASTYATKWAAADDDDDDNSHSGSKDESDAILGPLYLLQSSKLCNYRSSTCPDPYGKLKSYTLALEAATGMLSASFVEEEAILKKSEAMTTAGIVLLLLATCLVGYEVFQEFSGMPKSVRRSKGGLRKRVGKLVSRKGSKKRAPREEDGLAMPTISVTQKRSMGAGSIASVGSFGDQSLGGQSLSNVSVGSKKATWFPISLPDVSDKKPKGKKTGKTDVA